MTGEEKERLDKKEELGSRMVSPAEDRHLLDRCQRANTNTPASQRFTEHLKLDSMGREISRLSHLRM
jgi:hypothetical protein